MRSLTETRQSFFEGEGEDATLQVWPEKKVTKYNEEAAKSGKEPKDVVASQTFEFLEVENIDEAQELYGPTLLDVINRGGILKQQMYVRSTMTEDTFAAVEGVFSLREACAEVTERRKASPAEKVAKLLGKLSPDEIARILAQFQAV